VRAGAGAADGVRAVRREEVLRKGAAFTIRSPAAAGSQGAASAS